MTCWVPDCIGAKDYPLAIRHAANCQAVGTLIPYSGKFLGSFIFVDFMIEREPTKI